MTDDELNAKVAVEVMGWVEQIGGGWRKADYTSAPTPNFLSPDWSGVRLVCERMRELGYPSFSAETFDHETWLVSFTCIYGPCKRHGTKEDCAHGGQEYADTLPRAVCLAAIKAMEGKS